ncbi:MAG: DUF4838 domain-containing protein [Clostridia bacterium]|nr:DUF4838 domain-containing protein [Clostridia bacterium]
MKKFKFLSLILAGALCLGGLTACKDEQTANVPTVDSPYGDVMELAPAKAVDGSDLMLVDGGVSKYTVVIPETATAYEKTAASELQVLVKQSTGVTLPIVTDGNLTYDNTQYHVSIGETALYTALKADKGIEAKRSELGASSSLAHLEGNTLYLLGADGYGTLNSVYKFLDKQIGYEAYAVDEIYVDAASRIQIYDYDNTKFLEKSQYRVLEVGRVRPTGAVFDAAKLGLLSGSNGGCTIDGPLYAGPLAHTLQFLVPAEQSKEGWWNNGQLCLTNPEIQDFVAEASKSWIEKNKNAKYLVYGGKDNFTACDCDTCTAEAQKYGGSGGSMIKFCNSISEKLDGFLKEIGREDFKFIALNYHAYEAPPVKLDANGEYQPIDESVRARDNVGSMVCFIGADYGHSLDDPTSTINVTEYKKLKGWAACSDTLLAYLYLSNYSDYMMYYNAISSFQGWMRTLQQFNVEVPFTAITENEYSTFADLKVYLLSKLCIDATACSQEELTKNFMKHYYKAASNDMYEFYNAMRMHMTAISAMNGNNQVVNCYDSPPVYGAGKHYPINVINQFLTYFDKAYQSLENSVLTEEEKAVVAKRILAEEFYIRYSRYQNHRDYFTSEQLVAEKEFLNASAKTLGITKLSEYVEWVDL